MNNKQFEYIIELSESGSVSKAAEHLNMSQPSLSQYVKRLEKDLGVTLFERINGEIRLTDAGKVYIDAGKRIIDIERQMQNRFSDLKSNKSGSIVVGIAPTRCKYLMPEIVRRFGLLYPGMNLVIKERFLEKLIDDAEHGEFDLCVATLPVDENKFHYDLMMKEEVILAVPKEMDICDEFRRSAKKVQGRIYPAVDITRLNGAPYVFLNDSQPTQAKLNEMCESLGFSVKKAVQCMSIVTQFSMVKKGIGAALIPSSIAKHSATEKIEYFSIIQDIPEREMAVIYRKNQYLSKAIKDLKDIMTTI